MTINDSVNSAHLGSEGGNCKASRGVNIDFVFYFGETMCESGGEKIGTVRQSSIFIYLFPKNNCIFMSEIHFERSQ